MKKGFTIAIATVLITLILDQWLKVHIKLNYEYGESVPVIGNWFNLHFVENPGMAFGWKFPFLGESGAKILLTSLRLVAVSAICYYLIGLITRKVSTGLIISISLIFAGAFGNIIDSLFYGLFFSKSDIFTVAEMVPFGTGYTGFMTGKVVDMLSFDLFTIELPVIGNFNFFAPIFNLADVAISLGVGLILVFQRKNFQKEFFNKKEEEINTSLEAESAVEE